VVSAAVDGRVLRRIEVDEVDEQLATFDADETLPVPDDFLSAVPRTHRQLTALDVTGTLTDRQTDRHTHTHILMPQDVNLSQYPSHDKA